MKIVNPSIETGVLLDRSKEGSSKRSRRLKKPEETPIAPTIDEAPKEVVPLKNGVFKQIKKIAHKSRSSSDRSPSFSPSMLRKPHVTGKGVVIREVLVHVSLSSKKRKAEDMAKHISKKQKKKLRKLVINDESTEEEVAKDPPVTTFQDTSNMEMLVLSSQISQPEPLIVSLPLVTNVKTSQPQGTPIIVSFLFETSTIDILTKLPPFVTTSLDTNTPTFDNILNQPITSLFSSQSTEPPVNHEEAHPSFDDDENVFSGTFGDIQFDPEEEEIPENMILTGKQFKIMNQKLNLLLQIQPDGGGKHSVSILEVDLLLKKKEDAVT
ncbi:unnamed protein product [Lactuca saligna]|uniref:Uncharacterized protein n=1 Tax=Lactuca saligna TaxID=75948 RepID=A0AA35YH77_LACSI|nr:unnamed protein product [Lactuca saligna]